ncbi:luciferase family protein [Actinomadura sp. NPDC047616]|uniref:luciferase domain-containing protein n=1 Tax=Actinomadura sp. NPDC047616 TaxID=3155914 RepID=UPI00340013C4
MTGSGKTSHAGRIAARLAAWPGVSKVRADCGIGIALQAGGRQIVHLHCDDEAELRLTRPVVERLGGALAESGRVAIRAGGEWVAVRLDTDSDVALVVSLASVAIKANTTPSPPPSPPPSKASSPCGAAVRPPSAAHTGRLRRLAAVIPGAGPRPHL